MGLANRPTGRQADRSTTTLEVPVCTTRPCCTYLHKPVCLPPSLCLIFTIACSLACEHQHGYLSFVLHNQLSSFIHGSADMKLEKELLIGRSLCKAAEHFARAESSGWTRWHWQKLAGKCTIQPTTVEGDESTSSIAPTNREHNAQPFQYKAVMHTN